MVIIRCCMSFKVCAIAQPQYQLNNKSEYNKALKALPVLMCMENTVLRDMSRDKYNTWLCLVLYLSLSTIYVLCAIFSIHTHVGYLSNNKV